MIVVVEKGIGAGSGVTTLEVPTKNNSLDLDVMVKELYEMGVHSLFVEGGAVTFNQFLGQNLVQRAYIFESQKDIEVKSGSARIDHNKIKSNLKNIKQLEFNGDVFFTGKF